MSNSIVRIDDLSEAIKREIDAMNKEVIEGCNKAAEEAASDAVKELKSTSPVRQDNYKRKYPPGSYAKGWTKRQDSNEMGVSCYTIYNPKHYQLTHLLEFGHIIAATGERSKAEPHIATANENAAKEFVEKVEDMKL